jgi:hypothetical protein
MDPIKIILQKIQNSIDEFDKAIPSEQKKILRQVFRELQKLETGQGRILTRVSNLKLINGLRNTLKKIIINDEYLSQVKTFMEAFEVVTQLNNEYFKQFNEKFSPAKTLQIIKETSIEATVNSLTEAGIISNVVDPVYDLLRLNITTGGSMDDLMEEVNKQIVGTKDEPGTLQTLTKQVTTDAINQYSANYNKAVSADLNFKWSRYVGSLLATSREFCILMVGKDYYHESELPEILKGHIDGHNCQIYKKTGLPRGMVAGTDIYNFQVRRGGYNCGHQSFGVPDSAVPEELRNKFT